MTTSPGQPSRDQVAPPREFAGRLHRTGYLALAASGLALCTAFAAVAQIIQPETTELTPTTQTRHSTGGGGPTEIVPGQAVPAETTVVIDGVAVTGEMPASSGSPTTIITTDENGNRRTSVYTPPPNQPPPGSPDNGNGDGDGNGDGNGGSNDGEQPNPEPPGNHPGPNPSNTPEPEPEPEPEPTDPEPEPSSPSTDEPSPSTGGGGSSTSAAPPSPFATAFTTTSRSGFTTSPTLSGTTTPAH